MGDEWILYVEYYVIWEYFLWQMNIDKTSKYAVCKIRWILDGLDQNNINGYKKLNYQIINLLYFCIDILF